MIYNKIKMIYLKIICQKLFSYMEQNNIEIIKCSRCGSNNLDYFIIQIRATDEIPGKYHRCLDCQFGWKQFSET